jgi:MSHA biogenesis protein MshK
MDETVKRRLLTAALLAALVAFAGFFPLAAEAQTDPTRPPATLRNPVAPDAAVPAGPVEPRLQSILIARHAGGRHVAVIDGQTVRQGELFQGARLERMTETEVVLVKGKSIKVLKLFPAAAPQAPSLQR